MNHDQKLDFIELQLSSLGCTQGNMTKSDVLTAIDLLKFPFPIITLGQAELNNFRIYPEFKEC